MIIATLVLILCLIAGLGLNIGRADFVRFVS